MANPTSNESFLLKCTATVSSNLAKMEAEQATQATLITLKQNFSTNEPSNQQDSLVSMFIKGMKIIQDQAMVIEKQVKQLQQQEIEIEKLQTELKNAQKKSEHNQNKDLKSINHTDPKIKDKEPHLNPAFYRSYFH